MKTINCIGRQLHFAWVRVRLGKREYAAFFATLFLLQLILFLLLFGGFARSAAILAEAERLFSYHIDLAGLDSNQLALLENDPFTAFHEERVYTVVQVTPFTDAYGQTTYTAKLRLNAGRDQTDFTDRYLDALLGARFSDGQMKLSPTALTTAPVRAWQALGLRLALSLLFAAASCLLLILLYSIRINRYRFTYGIYMAYGADFRRLLQGELWEMIMVSLLVLPPAFGIALLIRLLDSLTGGEPFNGLAGLLLSLFIGLLLNLTAVFIAVWSPMRLLSLRAPVSLITGQDNAAWIRSPRRSVGQLSPVRYALLSVWRYRLYYLRLLLPAALFASLGVFFLYLGDMQERAAAQPIFAFTIEAEEHAPIDDLPEYLRELNGVDFLELTYRIDGFDADMPISFSSGRDLLLLPAVCIQNSSQFVPATQPGYMATMSAGLEPMTADVLSTLKFAADFPERFGSAVTVEGELARAVTDPTAIVISDARFNTTELALRPGDSVMIGKFLSGPPLSYTSMDIRMITNANLRQSSFDYRTFTVAAVIHGLPADRLYSVWLSPAAYAELLDTPPSLARIRVAVSPELDAAPRNALCDAIDQLRRIWGLSPGTDHIEAHFSEYVLAAQTPRLFPLLAILSLCFVPIIWFYTQSSFYAGRAQEYRTLTAFGALSKALQYQRRIEGVFCVGLAMLLTIGFAFGLTWGYFKLVNHLLYAGGFLTPSCRLTYGLSLPMLVISMIISLVCGLCSAALPSLVCKSTHECSQNVSHFL